MADPPIDPPGAGPGKKVAAALWGMYAGDALAFPTHWYYAYPALQRDLKEHYGGSLESYNAVPNGLKHPSSWKYYQQVNPADWKINIFHGDAPLWAVEGTHYHPGLQAGQNTTTVQLARELAASITAHDGYDEDDFLGRYQRYFTTPDGNPDTYIETMHREFFRKLGEGVDPRKCGTTDESCLSALSLSFPLVLYGISDQTKSLADVHAAAVAQVALLTTAPLIVRRLRVVIWLVSRLLSDADPLLSLRKAFEVLGAGQDLDLDALLLKDDTDLFWGTTRDSLGKGECGENRGTGVSVFSIS